MATENTTNSGGFLSGIFGDIGNMAKQLIDSTPALVQGLNAAGITESEAVKVAKLNAAKKTGISDTSKMYMLGGAVILTVALIVLISKRN